MPQGVGQLVLFWFLLENLHPPCLYAFDLVLSIASTGHSGSCSVLRLTVRHSHLLLLYQLLQFLRRVNIALQTESTVDDGSSQTRSTILLLEMHLLSQLESQVLLFHIELFPLAGVAATWLGTELRKLLERRWRLRVLDSCVCHCLGIWQLLINRRHKHRDTGSRGTWYACQVPAGHGFLQRSLSFCFYVLRWFIEPLLGLLLHHFCAINKLMNMMNIMVSITILFQYNLIYFH